MLSFLALPQAKLWYRNRVRLQDVDTAEWKDLKAPATARFGRNKSLTALHVLTSGLHQMTGESVSNFMDRCQRRE